MANYISVLTEHKKELIAAATFFGGVTLLTHKKIQKYLEDRGIIHHSHEEEHHIPNGHTYYKVE